MNFKETSQGFQLTFHKWIVQFKHEKTNKGTFARLVKADNFFPTSSTYNGIAKHLKKLGATPESLMIFEQLWQEFEGHPLAKIPHTYKRTKEAINHE